MLLREILQDVTVDQKIKDMPILALCCDSRQVSRGCLFFALKGSKLKGSSFIAEALKGGASAVVCSPDDEAPSEESAVIRVADARLALAEAACRFYQNPTEKFYLCGVTGTNGKTTLTYLLESIWKTENSGVIGTVNVRYQNKIFATDLTTPDTISMQRLFSEMAVAKTRFVVSEVSSHALEQKRACGSHFDSVVFTNLTQDHLDYHGNMESYFAAKKILFEDVIGQSRKSNRLMVINHDDTYGLRLLSECRQQGVRSMSFSETDRAADIVLCEASYSLKGTKAIFNHEGKTFEIKTNLIGRHNLRNIMAAILVARHSGIDWHQISLALLNIHVPGRLDRVLDSNFFVDYAHTPDALHNVLLALREIMKLADSKGRLMVVFGCGGDRDKTKRPLMGLEAAKLADVVIVTSDNPRTEDPQDIVGDILPGVVKDAKPFDGHQGYLVLVDRKAALQKACELSQDDDVVLVAGKGHEDYQILGTQKIHFDDKEILAGFLGG